MANALLNNLNNNIANGIYTGSSKQDFCDNKKFDLILTSKTAIEKNNKICDDEISLPEDDCTTEDVSVPQADVYEKDVPEAAEDKDNQAVTDENLTDIQDTDTAKDENTSNEESIDTLLEETTVIKNETNEESQTIIKEDPDNMNKQLQNALQNSTIFIVDESQSNLKNKVTEVEVDNVSQVLAEDKLSNSSTGNNSVLNMQNTKIFDIGEKLKFDVKKDMSEEKTVKDIIDENILEDLNIESVTSASTQNESGGDILQYQTPQEQAVKVMLQSEVKFDDVEVVLNKTSQQNESIRSGQIIEQIKKQLEGMYSTSKVNIVLNPASLGKVSLNIVNSKDGILAQFTVTNSETQNSLLKGLAGLKDTLLSQGINVDNVIVKLEKNENGENSYKQDWTEQDHSHGRSKDQGAKKHGKQEKNFEQMMFEINNT